MKKFYLFLERLEYNQLRIRERVCYQEIDGQILFFVLYIECLKNGVGVLKKITSGITDLLVESHGTTLKPLVFQAFKPQTERSR